MPALIPASLFAGWLAKLTCKIMLDNVVH